jgi:hypothetical protein
MVKPIIAIVRGKVAAGKSTAFANLRKRKKMDKWIFIDHPILKGMFDYMPSEKKRYYGKMIMIGSMREIMKEKKNIFLDEFSRDSLEKYLSKEIKKYDYKFKVFQFEVKLDHAVEREKERRIRKGKKPKGAEWVKMWHEHHEKNVDPEAVVINASKLKEKGLVNKIMRELKV